MAFRTSLLQLCLFFIIGFQTTIIAQQEKKQPSLWQNFSEISLKKEVTDRQIIPNAYRTVMLNMSTLQQMLTLAPMRFSAEAKTNKLQLKLPMPDGSFQTFYIVESPVLHPVLGAKFPMIRSYSGQGVDDPTAYVKFDVTQKGFHAMILSGRHSTVFIDPYAKNDTQHYICYYKKDFEKNDSFECLVDSEQNLTEEFKISEEQTKSLLAGDCILRKYRLALACTGEYAQYHGGTVADALAAMNTSMNRVNGVYERDASITMELVPGNDQIIYLNASTDPYTNNSGFTMLGENQTTIDNIIGSANYDIGHVFSTGGGGVASLNSPCNNNSKARGVTGQSNPIGDPFDIDYVSHEMGHQYGGNHTQNNNCNNVPGISVEPGSASTIMGYAGICSPNVQNNSDDYFHIINLREIAQNVTFGTSSTCPETIITGNNAPTANAGSNYTIPVSTPFILSGQGNDLDGTNSLTYNWEQMDAQTATMPPSSGSTVGPAFRSKQSLSVPERYCPPLDDVINGNTPTWEVLPAVGRTMKFTFTVRDNNPGSGCTSDDDMVLTFAGNAGPFLVTNPNTNIVWNAGSIETVTWNVANTNQSPVNCSNVDILLSLDGGYTYPVTLAEGVPNTGNFDVLVPNILGNNNRILIRCADNIFYDISNTEFSIEEGLAPDFIFSSGQGIQNICVEEEANYALTIDALGGFNDEVTFVVNGLPDGAAANFAPEVLNPSGTTTMTVSGFGIAAAGTYNIEVIATSSSVTKMLDVILLLTLEAPGATDLQSPANGATDQNVSVDLSWVDIDNVLSYQIQIATTPTFEQGTIIQSSGTFSPPFSTQDLQPLTVYYWRVKGANDCGDGDFSSVFSFQTGGSACQDYENTTVMPIDPNDTQEIISIIEVPENVTVSSIIVNDLDITHTWVGDLHALLYSPQGTTINLFDRPGVPADDFGCENDNLLVGFDDTSLMNSFTFENTCNDGSYAIEGVFRPIDPLTNFNNENAQGDWTLQLLDYINQDGGQLNGWGFTICFELLAPPVPTLTQQVLFVTNGDMGTITTSHLNASVAGMPPGDIVYTLMSLPSNGTLTLNGVQLVFGDTFSQADIDAGFLVYTHDGSDTVTDNYNYEVLSSEGGWIGGNVFNINIVDNTLAASITVLTPIDCNGSQNGQVEIAVSGGIGPFQYSLDGQNFQVENIFDNLPEGIYTAIIIDNAGNQVTTSEVVLINPDAIMASASVNEYEITVTASGGTGNLLYSVDGINFQVSNIFPDLVNGTYTITVSDANDCEVTIEATVAVNALTASIVLENDISCNNANDAVINVGIAGGMSPYLYSLNGGTPQTDNVFNNLEAGIYSVVVTDAQGFEIETTQIEVTDPAPIIASASVDEYEITVTASGGTGDLSYSIDSINFQTSNIFSDLVNGTYTIFIFDENNCQITVEATVAVNPLVAGLELANDISCNNADDATIIVEVSGGMTPYLYSLNGGNPQPNNIFDNLDAGIYSVLVTDAEGFEIQTQEVIVSNPAPITASANVAQDEITVTASGGTGSLLYSIDGVNFQVSNVFSDLNNNTYIIYVMDENGCQETVEVEINIIASAMFSIQTLDCFGDENGVIEITSIEGGISPFQYSLNESVPQSDNIFSDLSSGTYYILIEDSNGSTYNVTITLANPAPILIDPVLQENNLIINTQGGVGSLQFSIDGGASFGTQNTFNGLENGTYPIVVMDSNGCQESTTITVMVDAINDLELSLFMNVYPNPNSGQFVLDINQPTGLHLKLDIYDALGKLVYSTSFTKTTEAFQYKVSIEQLAAGAYFLRVTDGLLSGSKRVLVVK